MIYKAHYDAHNNYNDAPIRCMDCGHQWFRISLTCWICDNCEARNPPDKERSERYKRIKAERRAEKAKKRGKRQTKLEATDLDGLEMW